MNAKTKNGRTKRRAVLGLTVVGAVSVLLVLIFTATLDRKPVIQVGVPNGAPLALGDRRTITLTVTWDGDVHRSERRDCGVWVPSFNCELRRGGNLGVVATRTLPISAVAAVGEPGTGRWGSAVSLTWDISVLELGPYETFARLEVTDGSEVYYGYVEAEGHDGSLFYMVDKFQIGEICFFPVRFSATVPP